MILHETDVLEIGNRIGTLIHHLDLQSENQSQFMDLEIEDDDVEKICLRE